MFKGRPQVSAGPDLPNGQQQRPCYIAACKYISNVTGSCPGDKELIDMEKFGCDKKCCRGLEADCWMAFFKMKAV